MTDVSEDIAPAVAPARDVHRLGWARTTLARLGGVTLAVLIVGAYFSVRTHGQLLIFDNLLGILRGLSTIAIMGFGLTVVIIAGEIDLSFAAVYGLSTNIVAVLWITHGFPVYVAILARVRSPRSASASSTRSSRRSSRSPRSSPRSARARSSSGSRSTSARPRT